MFDGNGIVQFAFSWIFSKYFASFILRACSHVCLLPCFQHSYVHENKSTRISIKNHKILNLFGQVEHFRYLFIEEEAVICWRESPWEENSLEEEKGKVYSTCIRETNCHEIFSKLFPFYRLVTNALILLSNFICRKKKLFVTFLLRVWPNSLLSIYLLIRHCSFVTSLPERKLTSLRYLLKSDYVWNLLLRYSWSTIQFGDLTKERSSWHSNF